MSAFGSDPNTGRPYGPSEAALISSMRGTPTDSFADPYGGRMKAALTQAAMWDAANYWKNSGGGGYSSSSSRPVAMLDPVQAKDSSSYAAQMPNYESSYSKLWGTSTPEIDRSAIWNEQQIQARVNQARAQNDQSMSGMMRRTGESLASQGFGSRSPLLASLMQNAFMQNLAANTGAENNLRWEAARGNADQLLASQTAFEKAKLDRAQAAIQQQNQGLALLNALMQNDAANYAAYAGWAKTPVTSSVSYG